MSSHAGLRETIVRASLEIGSELGEDGLTMRGIASRLGVSATALYQHFENKAAILREIRVYGVDLMWKDMSLAQDVTDPSERMVRVCCHYIDFARAHPWLYRVLMESEQPNWDLVGAADMELLMRPLKLVRSTLADGQTAGTWPQALNADLVTFQLWAAMHGFCALMLSGRMRPDHPILPVTDDDLCTRTFVSCLVKSFIACPRSDKPMLSA